MVEPGQGLVGLGELPVGFGDLLRALVDFHFHPQGPVLERLRHFLALPAVLLEPDELRDVHYSMDDVDYFAPRTANGRVDAIGSTLLRSPGINRPVQ